MCTKVGVLTCLFINACLTFGINLLYFRVFVCVCGCECVLTDGERKYIVYIS